MSHLKKKAKVRKRSNVAFYRCPYCEKRLAMGTKCICRKANLAESVWKKVEAHQGAAPKERAEYVWRFGK